MFTFLKITTELIADLQSLANLVLKLGWSNNINNAREKNAIMAKHLCFLVIANYIAHRTRGAVKFWI